MSKEPVRNRRYLNKHKNRVAASDAWRLGRRMKSAFAFALLLLGAAMGNGAEPVVRDLGIPVKGVSWVRLHPGQTADGKPSLLASMSQNNGGLFVVDIDFATGHCRQFPVADPDPSHRGLSRPEQGGGQSALPALPRPGL